ncbi:hypothetical protein GJ496_007802 [Pomphorhynchus laevis]|nr:hypothetical protein GJ496_007802 [Pomphorhynchus laevis]
MHFGGIYGFNSAPFRFQSCTVNHSKSNQQDWYSRQQRFLINMKQMVMPQSLAIIKYLAREHNLDGKNNLESALIDVVVQTALEIFDFYYDVLYHLNKRIPQTISKLKQLMDMYNPYGKTPYFIGDKLSLADLFVFYALDQFSKINPKLAEECDEVIKKNWDAVANTPSIAEYMKMREY